MSVESLGTRCPRCGADLGQASGRFCWQCGAAQTEPSARLRLWTVARFLPPLITLAGSLMAWVTVSPANNQGWNVYHFGNAGWGWMAGDIVALLVVAAALIRPQSARRWLWTAWKVYGGLSLGMALSGLVFVQMGSTIAGLVNAPNPLALASGVFVFGVGCLLWLALSFTPAA